MKLFKLSLAAVGMLVCAMTAFSQPAGQTWSQGSTNAGFGVSGIVGANGLPIRQPTYVLQLTNFPMSIAALGNSNFVTQPLTIKPGYGIAAEILYQGGGTNTASVSNMWFFGNVTLDGTNWQTVSPFQFSLKMNGTNLTRVATNFPYSALDGYYQFALTGATNNDSSTNVINGIRLSRYSYTDPNNQYR